MAEYIDTGYEPRASDLICEFYVKPAKGISVEEAANHIAAESSIGTWTEIRMSKKIKEMKARVFEIDGNWIKIAYPSILFEPGNMPQILSSIAGNIFGMKIVEKLRLEDVRWPKDIMKSFKGPRFGVNGVRSLIKVKNRPLIGTIVKPKIGLNEGKHAKVAYEAWCGGVDIVKDDENLTNQSFNHFKKRVIMTLKTREKAEKETGERKMYMPNVSAEVHEMEKRAKFVKESGGEYIMVDIITVGWAGLQSIRNLNEELGMVIHAHRAGHAAFTRGMHGISMIVVADIARLIGVDQIHVGTVVGKMVGKQDEVVRIREEIEERFVDEEKSMHRLAEYWGNIKPVFAVCSGGIHPGLVSKLIEIMGNDIIIQAGGGIHGHPLGTKAGAKAMRQAVDAVMNNIPLKEYAKEHKELGVALNKWGFI
ncbi:MAG TPA: type III ribulose-bisphosphate carboxylase [Candidatus Aenigmarchaeota archaeon]|nr:MAG: type III ribulose-bisphosphate carboxylase [Candidatus Aenigmarchaeota archaeon]HDD46513.1 type III ribulose-bisphosphate carboxylase [Candidatus Aenigmarchaeota archaeon]